jgi:hypothetical protein
MTHHDDEASETRPFASPPCYAHELEREPLAGAELIAFLNSLLEGERAGARGLNDLAKRTAVASLGTVLLDVAATRTLCVMLSAHPASRWHSQRRDQGVLRQADGP